MTQNRIFAKGGVKISSIGPQILALFLMSASQAVLAEEPIIVHYSDPALTRMETQLGISAAQKERFEDIVTKYRDPYEAAETANPNQGHPGGRRHGGGKNQQANSDVSDAGSQEHVRLNKKKISREELDDLATILKPEQLRKFQQMNGAKKGH